ncbi:MAG: dihydrolipoamide dehydrogenase [Gammaproteobacteria bacterium]|jgi:dihydrolipoamide dehydrogenase
MSDHYKKPSKFDRNLIVIGAGSAGLVSAYIAAAVKAKVTLIEKHKMGGDCLNTGCVPSKALIRSANILAQAKRAREFGFKSIDIEYDFADIMRRVQRVISTIEPHDSVERFTDLGVECITGEARITSPYTVEVNDKTLTTRNIIIATGASPFIPPIPGIEDIDYLTSDTLWKITELPKRLLVLGGGPIGSELTQCFARFGSDVTQLEMLPRILMREDPEVSELIKQQFEKDGVKVLLEHTALAFKKDGERKIVVCKHDDVEIEIEFDALLVAVGRKPNVTGFGLEDLNIPTIRPGVVQTNDYLQTNYPNIFACGDVAGPYQFTHTAAHQAWYASVNALFGKFKKFKVDYSVIPWATFTDPEVARVGLNELEAKEKNIEYEVSTYGLDDLDRAIADEEAHGFVKVLTVPGKDKILGATIVGYHAGELITEYISAMRHDLGMNKILGTIHIYPTLSEANKFTAGIWKKAHAPKKLLKLVKWFHKYQLG